MLFISFFEVRDRLREGVGKIEVKCIVTPEAITNAVAGEWEIYYISNALPDERVPLVTSGRNPRLRVAKRLHGLFTLLHSLNLSPIEIPTIPGQACLLSYASTPVK